MPLEHLFLGLFVVLAAYFLFQVVRNKGFRGAMFGAPVLETVGEVRGIAGSLVSTKLKVHVLDGREELGARIGLELVATSIGSWQMVPIALSRTEAQALQTLLEQALRAGALR